MCIYFGIGICSYIKHPLNEVLDVSSKMLKHQLGQKNIYSHLAKEGAVDEYQKEYDGLYLKGCVIVCVYLA